VNPQIQALAAQAKIMAEEEINRQISHNAELKAFAEKFTELIVRECIQIDDDTDYIICANETMSVGSKIARHFGVDA
jgi:tRNA A37 threonylcarbamoyladenosine dehydratase